MEREGTVRLFTGQRTFSFVLSACNKLTAILRARLKGGRSSAIRERSARISTLIGRNYRVDFWPAGKIGDDDERE
jgi:hypothetical protein